MKGCSETRSASGFSLSKVLGVETGGLLVILFLFGAEYYSVLPPETLVKDGLGITILFTISGLIIFSVYRSLPCDPLVSASTVVGGEFKPPLDSWYLQKRKRVCSWTKVVAGDKVASRRLLKVLANQCGISWLSEKNVVVKPIFERDNSVLLDVSSSESRAIQVKLSPDRTRLTVNVIKEQPPKPDKFEPKSPDLTKPTELTVSMSGAEGRTPEQTLFLKPSFQDLQTPQKFESSSNLLAGPAGLLSRINGCIPLKEQSGKRLNYELDWFKKAIERREEKRSLTWWFRVHGIFTQILEVLSRRRYQIIDSKDTSATTLGLNEFSDTYKAVKDLDSFAFASIKALVVNETLSWLTLLVFFPLAYLVFIPMTNLIMGSGEFAYFWVAATWIVLAFFSVGLYSLTNYLLSELVGQSDIASNKLLVNVISTLILSSAFTIFAWEAIQAFPSYFNTSLSSHVTLAISSLTNQILISIVITVSVVIVLRDLVTLFLTRAAGSLPIIQDEGLILAIQRIVIIYALIIASGIFVVGIGIAPAAYTTIIYILLLSAITAAIGYASRETLENFIAGLILRVNPPFLRGDRVIITPDELCDVKEIGMRTTRLYDVDSHTEVYYPNKDLVSTRIVNVSRPDPELRVKTSVYLPYEDLNLRQAELMLLDVAYESDDVEQSLVSWKDVIREHLAESSEIKKQIDEKVRTMIEEEIKNLQNAYPEINTAEVRRLRHQKLDVVPFETATREALKMIEDSSSENEDALKSNDCSKRHKAIEKRVKGFQDLSNAIFSVSDQHPELKEKLEPILSEMSREPFVQSDFEKERVKFTLHVFVQHLERRVQVQNDLNKSVFDTLLARNNILHMEDEACTRTNSKSTC